MQDINIITSVSRLEFLDVIKKNIEEELFPYFNVKWYCIYDIGKGNEITHRDEWIKSYQGGIPNDRGGGSQRNVALKMIKSGWVYCLDDDNLFYKGFGKIMNERISQNPTAKAFVFNQDCCGHRDNLFAKPDNIKVGSVDMAQILFDISIVGDVRFDKNNYFADGYFIEQIFFNNRNGKFIFLNEYLCYWNALQPNSNASVKEGLTKDVLWMRNTPNLVMGLLKLIQTIKDSGLDTSSCTMIEIGSYAGESTGIFANHFKKVIAVDSWENNYDKNDATCDYAPLAEIEKVFDEKVKDFKNIVKLKMKSDDAVPSINEPISFVYIDGMHTYEQVKKDIENYMPLLAGQDYFIGGHDYSDKWLGVKKAVIEKLGNPEWIFDDTSWLFKVGGEKKAIQNKQYGSNLERNESAFNERTPHLLVVDSFYKNPDTVRDFALSKEFTSSDKYYKGKRTDKFLFHSVKEEFERLLNVKITDWLTQPANGIFQITSKNDPLVWHSDNQSYAGAIYLTPDADSMGTSFWRDKKYGCRRPPNHPLESKDAPVGDIYSEFNLLHSDNWELVDKVGAVYNRLVLWDAQMIHSASQYGDKDRLVQLFFFSVT